MTDQQSMHSDIINSTAESIMTTLSLLIPEAGYKAIKDPTSYFTRFNMAGTDNLLIRKEAVGAMLCDYERIYGEVHPLDAQWDLLENVCDAAAHRLYPHPVQIVEQDKALHGARFEHEFGVRMFREVQKMATGDTEWALSRGALNPLFN